MYEGTSQFQAGYPRAIRQSFLDTQYTLNATSLRHTVGTLLAQTGASAKTIMAVLKHVSDSTCKAYVDIAFHGLIEELSEAMLPAFTNHLPGLLNFRSKNEPVATEKVIRSEDLETGRIEERRLTMAGRKEILTEQLARKIAKMIELFPDNQIPVTWENVMAHSKKRFGHGFNRQMLGQKAWDGRKIIAEAFSEAKSVQRRMHNDFLPKYRNAPRAVLQNRIAELEARNMALKEELEKVRAQQIDELDAFLNTPRDICQLIERFATKGAPVDELRQKRGARKQATSQATKDDLD